MRSGAFTVTAATLFLFSAGNIAWADAPTFPHDMPWGGGWFMMPIMMLIFLAILALFVVLIVRRLWPSGLPGGSGESTKRAISILEERFARGEIEKEEFEEKKRILEK